MPQSNRHLIAWRIGWGMAVVGVLVLLSSLVMPGAEASTDSTVTVLWNTTTTQPPTTTTTVAPATTTTVPPSTTTTVPPSTTTTAPPATTTTVPPSTTTTAPPATTSTVTPQTTTPAPSVAGFTTSVPPPSVAGEQLARTGSGLERWLAGIGLMLLAAGVTLGVASKVLTVPTH